MGVYLRARVLGPDTRQLPGMERGKYYCLDVKEYGADIANIRLIVAPTPDQSPLGGREAPTIVRPSSHTGPSGPGQPATQGAGPRQGGNP